MNKKVQKEIKEEKNEKKISMSSIIKKYIKFYNENIRFKHIIITIIMLILFFIMLNFNLNKFGSISNNIQNISEKKSILYTIVKEKAPLSAVIIFAGITPFAFLSVLGIIYSYILAINLCKTYLVSKGITVLIFGSISAVIQIIGIAISIATGIYYCIQSGKKFRYNQYVSFGIKDVKCAYYQMRNNEEKLEKLKDKEQKKAKKREKLNVKIPYINFIISFVVTMIFLIVGAIIDYII